MTSKNKKPFSSLKTVYEGELRGKGNGLQPLSAAPNEEPPETL